MNRLFSDRFESEFERGWVFVDRPILLYAVKTEV